MSRRTIATPVGILFIAQMVTAMIGTSLIQSFVNGNSERAPLIAGVGLMVCSGLAVVGIGFLMYQVLKDVNQRVARWYPALRVTEFAVSTACGVFLLIQLQVVPNHLLWVYIPTGIGGLVLNYLLFVSRLVPRPIAVLGLVGYGLFSLGVPLDLLGVLNMNEGAGMLMLVPGLLFELVVLPIWLIAKGFPSPCYTPAVATSVLAAVNHSALAGDGRGGRGRLPAAEALATATSLAGDACGLAGETGRLVPLQQRGLVLRG